MNNEQTQLQKTCPKCRLQRLLEEFSPKSRVCKPCKNGYMKVYRRERNCAINVAKRAWWKKNAASGRLSRKKWYLKSQYGLTLEQYTQMFIDQKNCCAICGKQEKVAGIRLAVDHCKVSGKIRGLLCFDCNTGIGKLNDSPDMLKSALKYLEK